MNNWNNISLEGFRGILCDLDDTLYAYEPCNKAGYEAAKRLANVEFGVEPDSFDKLWNAGREKVHFDLAPFAAGHSRLMYAQKLAESHFGYTHADFTVKIEEAYWSTFLDAMKWNMEAENFLIQAKKAGMVVCIVTDLTAQIQHHKWLKLDLGRFARYMVSSEEAGYEKPNPVIFKLALDKLGMKPDEVIMIGDSHKKDILGAEALGIRAYHIKNESI